MYAHIYLHVHLLAVTQTYVHTYAYASLLITKKYHMISPELESDLHILQEVVPSVAIKKSTLAG